MPLDTNSDLSPLAYSPFRRDFRLVVDGQTVLLWETWHMNDHVFALPCGCPNTLVTPCFCGLTLAVVHARQPGWYYVDHFCDPLEPQTCDANGLCKDDYDTPEGEPLLEALRDAYRRFNGLHGCARSLVYPPTRQELALSPTRTRGGKSCPRHSPPASS
jgi:hypothetical protein